MSFYSLDSLEAGVSFSDDTESSESRGFAISDTVSFNSDPAPPENHRVIERPNRISAETRNPLIARASPETDPEVLGGRGSPDESLNGEGYPTAPTSMRSSDVANSLVSIPLRGNSTLNKKQMQSSSRSAASAVAAFKNDKKLANVLAPVVIAAKTKPKTYLERYHEKFGLPAKKSIHSPEGSTLSVYGDTSYEPITDVDSRPPSRTPRDDQSELSFYRRLINQPRTTRSCSAGRCPMIRGEFRSVSEYGLSMNGGKKRAGYSPYSIEDYECLTIPRADRSLGPDAAEIREKWEKLMRRTQYGDLASSRNRQDVLRRLELRKCKRTNVQKRTVKFPSAEDEAAGQVAESKNFGDTQQPDQPNSAKISPALKKPQRRFRSKQILSAGSIKGPTSSTRSQSTGRRSLESLIRSLDENTGDSSLEDLQRRHQNEKRVMDLLINRTLLR